MFPVVVIHVIFVLWPDTLRSKVTFTGTNLTVVLRIPVIMTILGGIHCRCVNHWSYLIAIAAWQYCCDLGQIFTCVYSYHIACITFVADEIWIRTKFFALWFGLGMHFVGEMAPFSVCTSSASMLFEYHLVPDYQNSYASLHTDGSMQERRNSIALAMELHLCCINPWIWFSLWQTSIVEPSVWRPTDISGLSQYSIHTMDSCCWDNTVESICLWTYDQHSICGEHFTNNFPIIIQIRWKINSAVIQVVGKWSLLNFAHGLTPVLSCPQGSYTKINFPLLWNYDGKIVHGMDPGTHTGTDILKKKTNTNLITSILLIETYPNWSPL